ncbi:hypothetical protein LINPERPRIM_LOCUS40017 [Linum perenne]
MITFLVQQVRPRATTKSTAAAAWGGRGRSCLRIWWRTHLIRPTRSTARGQVRTAVTCTEWRTVPCRLRAATVTIVPLRENSARRVWRRRKRLLGIGVGGVSAGELRL